MKQLAERRTDIFGVGDEETAIGKKIGEEDKRKDDKVNKCINYYSVHSVVKTGWTYRSIFFYNIYLT